jgi:hypothetical protein
MVSGFKSQKHQRRGPSPSGRRWREAPDEGSRDACVPSPALRAPSPGGRGTSKLGSVLLTDQPDPIDNSTVLFSRRLIGLFLAIGLLTLSVCAQACPPADEAQQPLCPEHQKHDCCKHGSSDSTAAGQIAFTSGCIIKSSPVEMSLPEAPTYELPDDSLRAAAPSIGVGALNLPPESAFSSVLRI